MNAEHTENYIVHIYVRVCVNILYGMKRELQSAKNESKTHEEEREREN